MPYYDYDGAVRSALARVRRELKAAGISLGRVEGRYHAFGPAQKIVPGWNVARVGMSSTVALHFLSRTHKKADEAPPLVEVVALLRTKGLPFDERGWMTCRYG